VVATQDEEVLGVLDFVRQEQADCLQGLLAAINVVAQEEIVRFWGEASVLEQTEEIVVLSMDVAAYLDASVGPQQARVANLDGSLKLEQNRLADEDLARLGAQPADLLLEELDLFAGTASADFQQSFYDGIEVHVVVGHADG
jgi:hypothetical protein